MRCEDQISPMALERFPVAKLCTALTKQFGLYHGDAKLHSNKKKRLTFGGLRSAVCFFFCFLLFVCRRRRSPTLLNADDEDDNANEGESFVVFEAANEQLLFSRAPTLADGRAKSAASWSPKNID